MTVAAAASLISQRNVIEAALLLPIILSVSIKIKQKHRERSFVNYNKSTSRKIYTRVYVIALAGIKTGIS